MSEQRSENRKGPKLPTGLSEADLRQEVRLLEEDFEDHLDNCPICDEDAEDFCPRGSMMSTLLLLKLVEMMRVVGPEWSAERKDKQGKRRGGGEKGND